MRFIYFYLFAINKDYGPNKKVLNQCLNLFKNGLDVDLFHVETTETCDLNLEFNEIRKIIKLSPFTRSKILHKIQREWELGKILINLIDSASSSDVIYLRYPYPLFYMLLSLLNKGKRCKIVNEHNTIENNEFKLVGSWFSWLFLFVDLAVGNLLRRRADGIVGVTDEITSYELFRSGDFDKPHITIGNGIDVSKIRIRKPPDFTGEELCLLCVASVSRWHGLDRLLKGLALYRGKTRVHLCIAGNGKEILNLKALVRNLNLQPNVIFTGFMSGKALDDLFDKSHLAVGSLGLHRMDMKEGSILKAREYCARGIPFLNGCSDPDFSDDFTYLKKVPGDESPIDIDEIILFVEKVYSDPEHHLKMRAYAEKNLDWSIKMKRLKEFCERLVDR